MRRWPLLLSLSLSLLASPGGADPSTATEQGPTAAADPPRFGEHAPLRAALKQEIQRGLQHLELPNMPRPYYAAATLSDNQTLEITASLGAIVQRRSRRSRSLEVDLRVGDYAFDNAGFLGAVDAMPAALEVALDATPLEIRRTAWLALDAAYKSATENYQGKRAARSAQARHAEPELASFLRVPPVVSVSDQLYPLDAEAACTRLVSELSRVFRDYPFIQSSGVVLLTGTGRRMLVNNEGTDIVEPKRRLSLMAWATTQASDGMVLGHHLSRAGRQLSDLPSLEQLQAAVREMATALGSLREAPVVDNYTGPLLFEGAAAAQLVHRLVVPELSGTPAPEMPGGFSPDHNSWASRVGLRVLPGGFSLVDDPTLASLNGKPVFGGFVYDDEGVHGQPVTLVSNGTLKNLLTTRTPSKEFSGSNGHARHTSTGTLGRPSILQLATNRGTTRAGLRAELQREVHSQQLPYGFIVRLLEEPMTAVLTGAHGGGTGNPQHSGSLTTPVLMSRLLPNGTEELVRGARIGGLEVDDLGDILAATRSLTHYHSNADLFGAPGGVAGVLSLAVPDLLIRRADVQKPRSPHTKPPVMGRPSP